jgi:heptosyltransferase-2
VRLAESAAIISAMSARPLIIRLRNWVGDVVLGLPALQRLEQAGYQLHLVGKGWAADLLAGHGWPVQPVGRTMGERVAQLRQLRQQARAVDPGFDGRINAIAFPYSLSSALDMRLAGLKAIGHRHEGRGWLLHRAVQRPPRAHEMAVYGHLANVVLGEDLPPPDRVQLQLAPAHQQAAAELKQRLGLRTGYVVICPFAGGTFEKLDKSWPHFARFAAEALPPLGRDVLICPGPGEEQALAERSFTGCTIAPGVGLGAYAALLHDAALVVSNDTGPGHMAAAVGAPLLSVLGPTDPARWGAIGPQVHVMRQAPGWPSIEAVLARTQALLQGR